VFTSIDYEKFRTLRITHVATRFEELIADEANDELTPEQLFLTAIDDALEQRRANRIAALIRKAGFPIPTATIAELDYREGRGINPTRMRRYAAHDWSAEPVNLLINSPTGGGKTYLACAIGIAACQNQHDVAYTRMDELARKLVIARANTREMGKVAIGQGMRTLRMVALDRARDGVSTLEQVLLLTSAH